MTRHDVHVVPLGDRWAVLREGDDEPVSVHGTLDAAETAGRLLAEDGGVAYELHPADGPGDVFPDDPRDERQQ